VTLFISVVNHNHDEMICDNSTLKDLALEHQVILKSNTQASTSLKKYCEENQIHLIQGTNRKGFGANNNEVFRYAEKKLGMKNNDYFLVLNPDVEIDAFTIFDLLKRVKKDNSLISTINLYRDREMTIYDNSIRRFPSLLNPIKTLFGMKRTDHYDKSKISTSLHVDWAAGSFLLFEFSVYEQLNGFDEKYFMYFEDADICRRASMKDILITYYPYYKAIHDAQFNNRSIFTKTFIYYAHSNFRYFITSILERK